ncbi:hypothetical protein AVEN_79007-1 [Araneus ventricosus]|uniref:Uncharacterized protein n=1 Tax=Araneus ventricosus TaxID=182803 RepID=A0A4Y2TG63_ARAVE|nr:hypothetical protein AVEN_79007-1 [Araneus ventricosus]
MGTCQVLLQRSEEMKITWCEIQAVGRMFHCLCGERARQFYISVFAKQNRVSTPVSMTLNSLCKLPLVGDEFQLGCFHETQKPHYTSHFNRRPCIRQCHRLLIEISERYCTTRSISRWRLNVVIVYSIKSWNFIRTGN